MSGVQLASSVGEISIRDPDAAVQDRAAVVVQSLIEMLGGGRARESAPRDRNDSGTPPQTVRSTIP